MGNTSDLEAIYKELQEKNQAAKAYNIKAQTQLEESVKRIKTLLDGQNIIDIDYDRLSNKEYVTEVLTYVKNRIEELRQEFISYADKAREELNQ